MQNYIKKLKLCKFHFCHYLSKRNSMTQIFY